MFGVDREIVTATYSALLGGLIAYLIAAWRMRKMVARINHNDRQIAGLLAALFRRQTGDKRSAYVDDDGYLRINVKLEPDSLSQEQSVDATAVRNEESIGTRDDEA